MRAKDPYACERCGFVAKTLEDQPREYVYAFGEKAAGLQPKTERLCRPCARHEARMHNQCARECRERSRLGFRRRAEALKLEDLLIERSSVTPRQLAELMKAAPCSTHALADRLGVAYQTARKSIRGQNVSEYVAGIFFHKFRVHLVPGVGGRFVPEGRPAAAKSEEEK